MATRPTPLKRKMPVAEFQLAIAPDTSFDDLVATLKGCLLYTSRCV